MTAYCLAPTLITNGKRAVNDLNNRTIWPNTEYRILDCSGVVEHSTYKVARSYLCNATYNYVAFRLDVSLLYSLLRQCSRHGPVVSSQGEGGVEEDAALATHVLLVRAGAVSTRCKKTCSFRRSRLVSFLPRQ